MLIATTRPARIKDQNGRRLTGYRIGPAAQAMAEAMGTLLAALDYSGSSLAEPAAISTSGNALISACAYAGRVSTS